MSKVQSTIADRYAAVMEIKNGKSIWSVGKKYKISSRTLKYLVYRYDNKGYEGLEYKPATYHLESEKLKILHEYESEKISKEELCLKHNIMVKTLDDWLKKYELYKKGDTFALNGGGMIHKVEKYSPMGNKALYTVAPDKGLEMNDKKTKTQSERKSEISKMSKDELCELLLDREAEVEFLKKLEALDQERERRQAMQRK